MQTGRDAVHMLQQVSERYFFGGAEAQPCVVLGEAAGRSYMQVDQIVAVQPAARAKGHVPTNTHMHRFSLVDTGRNCELLD